MSIFNVLVERLASEPFFADYKLRKRDSSLIKQTDNEKVRVIFNHYVSAVEVDDGPHKYVATVCALPTYLKRFEVLHKWFEKYSTIRLVDLRSWGSIYFSDATVYGKWTFFQFYQDGANFESEYKKIYEHITTGVNYLESNFRTLQQLYEYKVKPVLNGEKPYEVETEYIFFDLALVKLQAPEEYDLFKSIAMERIEFLMKQRLGKTIGNPNIVPYYPKLNDIFHELETVGPTL